ncbi:MAG TPA: MBL fold metallo-hydrolase [Tepidisphaeraceae bacterium]|nr:MBL fold metallo-hydrolase [Tepidisphaeraceae bacterium]
MSHPRTFRINSHIHCVMRRSYFTCSYLVDTENAGLIAIDAGMKSTGSDMFHALKELGRSPRDITAILLTHWHNDHASGAAELAAASGAQVYYHSIESPYFTRERAASGFRSALSRVIPETGPLVLLHGLLANAPDRAVHATRHVVGGDSLPGDFLVLDTPGHTVGHVSYYHHPTRTLFAGDALAVINQRLRFMARPVTENLAAARASIIHCLDRPIDFVCPGHREPLTQNASLECTRLLTLARSNAPWPLFG